VLTITGPAKVVTGELTARSVSDIVFDTTNGDVDLYVTGDIALSDDVALTNTSERPGKARILHSGTHASLDSDSRFLGVVYAPSALVNLGRRFDLFGALLAERVRLSDRAKVHIDRALLGASGGQGEMIDTVAWRVVDVPAPAMRTDPFRLLGTSRDQLPAPAEAHDLSQVSLSIAYVMKNGKLGTYDGPEEDFDWSCVAKVVSSHRSLQSQHWEHDCSLHHDPRLAQNGYDGTTRSLLEATVGGVSSLDANVVSKKK
jgi:hypothetical protein